MKLPVLKYNSLLVSNFDIVQSNKLIEELEEYMAENDSIKKACELFDMLQVCFSFFDKFDKDIIDQAYQLNMKKHKDRQKFDIIGKYEIFKIMHKK
jgi:hypothetical protein